MGKTKKEIKDAKKEYELRMISTEINIYTSILVGVILLFGSRLIELLERWGIWGTWLDIWYMFLSVLLMYVLIRAMQIMGENFEYYIKMEEEDFDRQGFWPMMGEIFPRITRVIKKTKEILLSKKK